LSISSAFFERNCAIFFAPLKSLTFTSSKKKLGAKLLYKRAAHKLLVKLTQGCHRMKKNESKKRKK
jgi:hypothetical protein